MAIEKMVTKVQAVAIFQNGLDEKGGPMLKNKIISGVSRDATDQGIYDLVTTIGGLQDLTLVGIENRTSTSLMEI